MVLYFHTAHMTWLFYLYMPLRSQHTCLEFTDEKPEQSPEYSGTRNMAEEKRSYFGKTDSMVLEPNFEHKTCKRAFLIHTIHLPESQLNIILQSRYLSDNYSMYELPNIPFTCPPHPRPPVVSRIPSDLHKSRSPVTTDSRSCKPCLHCT